MALAFVQLGEAPVALGCFPPTWKVGNLRYSTGSLSAVTVTAASAQLGSCLDAWASPRPQSKLGQGDTGFIPRIGGGEAQAVLAFLQNGPACRG